MKKFMRTRSSPQPAAPGAPQPHKANGISNGSGPRRDDQRSTLSRYWGSSSEGAAPWEDPEFPASAASLGSRRLAQRTHWLRPHEICSRPRFLGDSALLAPAGAAPEPEPAERFAARWRVAVGEAGSAALCCAAAALALTPSLLARVAPPQSFGAEYTGRFRFRLWEFGAWREVCVDDRLPARGGRLLSSRGALPDDFTLPLLEKAYAKLLGGYARLAGAAGAARALQALSGGVVQSFAPPRQPRALLLQVLLAAVPRSTLLVATAAESTPPEKEGPERRLRNGLVAAQAYCVVGVERGAHGALLRLRAPSGRGAWAGPTPRGAPDAPDAPDEPPGHFWMPFAEFAPAFARLELVHVGPDDWLREPALRRRRPWRAVLARRRWRRGVSAGGPPAAPTAHANPHFALRVAARCHVVVSVTQQYAAGAPERLLGIGFAVYELPPGAAPRRAPHAQMRALDVTHWSRAREVVTFFTLPAGAYVVVPHAHRAHAEAAFLLRILTDEPADVWEVNDDNAIVRDVAAELELPAELRAWAERAARRAERGGAAELDAERLRALLRRAGRRVLPARPTLELCRALVALRDPAVSGRLAWRELPALLARLALWRAALAAAAPGCARRLSAYALRALLWACGVSASNKVLECLVLRYARGAALDAGACVLALARLHLAHERFRSLDCKLKSNPLSLEEVILMTLYS